MTITRTDVATKQGANFMEHTLHIRYIITITPSTDSSLSDNNHITKVADSPVESHPWASYQTRNCELRVRREWRERFPCHWLQRNRLVSDPARHASRHVRHPRAVMHIGIANPRWLGKRSRHSRCMRNPQFTYLVGGPCLLSVTPIHCQLWMTFYEKCVFL